MPTEAGDPLLLLDTHVWIWWIEGDERHLGHAARNALARGSGTGSLCVSVISVWEIAVLQARSRLALSVGIEEWVRQGLTAPGIVLQALSPAIAINSNRLPGSIHRDPADRILVSTARHLGASLVTRDGLLLKYAEDGHLSVLDATP
jgi:PIN domain nuclease of toxin-antitoxin system